jgi:limonene-1,2-epoxide hydrolase
MAPANVEIVRRFVKLANDRDLDAMAALCDRDAVLYAPDGWPEPGPWRGLEAFMGQIAHLQADSAEHALSIDEIAAHEDWVLAKHVWYVRGKRSGIETQFHSSGAYRLHAGKIIEVRYYREHADALKAVGLASS